MIVNKFILIKFNNIWYWYLTNLLLIFDWCQWNCYNELVGECLVLSVGYYGDRESEREREKGWLSV